MRDWPDILTRLRSKGWRVAAHNDYRQGGESFTFWLLVDGEGWSVKGEGRTDGDAFEEIMSKLSGKKKLEGATKPPPSRTNAVAGESRMYGPTHRQRGVR